MPMIPKSEREEWRKVCEAATPGPWGFVPQLTNRDRDHARVVKHDHTGIMVPSMARGAKKVCDCGSGDIWLGEGGVSHFPHNRDAEFIATVRHALPACLDALDEAEARIRELEKDIEHHSQTWQVRRIEDLESEIRDLRSAHRQRIPR